MIFDTLDRLSEAAAARYAMLTDSWRHLFLQALGASNFGTAQQSVRIVADAYQIAESFLAEERQAVVRAVEEIASDALQTTLAEIVSIDAQNFTPRAQEHLSATEQYLGDEIVAQIHRDIATLRQNLQQVVLQVSLTARSNGISERKALIAYRLANKVDLEFVFFDRAARKWQARKFIRSLWRMTLLATYNEIVLLTLADHGLKSAQVTFEQGGILMRGQVISIAGAVNQESYADIRAATFQPNAKAVLAMETTGV